MTSKTRRIVPWIAAAVGVIMAVPVYEFGMVWVVGFGLGNSCHFSSPTYQLERANRLLEANGNLPAKSLDAAAHALLPAGSTDWFWTFDVLDDSWLDARVGLGWVHGGQRHHAVWEVKYCADLLWHEHFVQAIAQNRDADHLTPSLKVEIGGPRSQWRYNPVDGGRCVVQ